MYVWDCAGRCQCADGGMQLDAVQHIMSKCMQTFSAGSGAPFCHVLLAIVSAAMPGLNCCMLTLDMRRCMTRDESEVPFPYCQSAMEPACASMSY